MDGELRGAWRADAVPPTSPGPEGLRTGEPSYRARQQGQVEMLRPRWSSELREGVPLQEEGA